MGFRACGVCSLIPQGGWRPVSRALVRLAGPSLSIAQSRAGQKEETMTTTDILLLIDALAGVIAAIAQLVAAMRRPP